MAFNIRNASGMTLAIEFFEVLNRLSIFAKCFSRFDALLYTLPSAQKSAQDPSLYNRPSHNLVTNLPVLLHVNSLRDVVDTRADGKLCVTALKTREIKRLA